MKIHNILVVSAISALGILGLAACDDMLNVNAEEVVESSENYQNVYDADNAIWGLYGKFAKLAEDVVVLNELRADLMDVTSNATADQVAISNNTADESNQYCDPTPFYEVILNANDILYNFDKMLAENKISQENYDPRYSDVMAIRCWTYLQLGIQFGNVPYVTDPIESIDALDNQELYPEISLDQLITNLISDMENIPTLEVNTLSSFYGKTISNNGESFYLNMQFINKHLLLGDLYLWNDDYVSAATQYKAYMDEDDVSSSKTQINNKVSGWVWAGTNEPRFQICYQRYKDQDVTSYRNMWKEIFYRGSTDVGSSANVGLQDEMIWMVNYSGTAESTSPFVKLFANTGVGEYQLRPSVYVVDSLWETQVQQSNGFVFDGRGRESSFDSINGQPVVLKYLYDYYTTTTTDANKTIHLDYYSIDNPYTQSGKWFLYRAALLHLRYAEAANRAGYPRLAYALLNNGVKTNFDWEKSDGSSRADKEGVQYTSYPPANDSTAAVPYPAPFYLDARQNDAPYTFLRSPWRDNAGIRNRAFLTNIETPDYVHDGTNDHNDSIQWIENALIKEAALECAFEGNRWGDLLRVARRQNKDGKGSVASLMNAAVSHKFNASGGGSANITDANLYLPMKK
ncbi:MAG: RagB/SusD family nutrient uptake outer membrane protein [Paludibacter sp.]|nr:RagB/SusD family nutrient uptake outer membrane protein [Paludibacter sp.]